MSMFVHPLEGAACIIHAANRPGQHNFLLQIWKSKIYSVPYVFIVWLSQENIYSLLSIRSSFVPRKNPLAVFAVCKFPCIKHVCKTLCT